MDLLGNLAKRHNQVLGRLAQFPDRRYVGLEIAVVFGAQRGIRRRTRGQRRVERAVVGAENLRVAENAVKVRPHHAVPAGPIVQPSVAPENRVVTAKQNDAVRHALQDLFVLQQFADLQRLLQMVRSDNDGVELLLAQILQGANRILHDDEITRRARRLHQACHVVRTVADTKNSRFIGQGSNTPAATASFSSHLPPPTVYQIIDR